MHDGEGAMHDGEGAVRDGKWVLKTQQRVNGPSYVVEEFDDERPCRQELEVMQKQFPGHVFWCEFEESVGVGDGPWTGE